MSRTEELLAVRHFLTLKDFEPDELRGLIERAAELKKAYAAGSYPLDVRGKVLGMIFEKSSTRTRVSFEAAMARGGGHAIFLSPRDTQLGRGEPVADTARVLSRMTDIIMIRTFAHQRLQEFARASEVPVINALTDRFHPCQLLADMLTYFEFRGDISGRTVAYIGDGNNMCHSYLNAAERFGFHLKIACPAGFEPVPEVQANAGALAEVFTDPVAAVAGADLVVTDVWTSMGQEDDMAGRRDVFSAYQVNAALMRHAADEAIFMHCLPAHRGEEVTDEVIDGPQSVVWDESENRMHTQAALLELLLR